MLAVAVRDDVPGFWETARELAGLSAPSYNDVMRRGMARRWALAPVVLLLACSGLWIAIHRVPWLGPLLADTARSVLGPAFVARVEDSVYGLEDRWNRAWRSDESPRAYWSVPTAAASSLPAHSPTPSPSAPVAPAVTAFRPADVGPLHDKFSAPGDGSWVPVEDSLRPSDPPRMFKTLVHPDRKRPWTAVAVVAIDLTRVELHLMAGEYVPEATEPRAYGVKRPAIIPAEHQPSLLAAFNGGFKTIHGRLGMHVDGVTLVAAQPWGCTVSRAREGGIFVGTWERLPGAAEERVWWRQAPTCLVESGTFGPGVLEDNNVNWGTSVHGSTFIRRSAVGLNAPRSVLFVGIGDAISARAMAMAMKHAGASSVAQLDVNWTLPKFLIYRPRAAGNDDLVPEPLYPGLPFSRDEYVRARSPRDFFYVTRRPAAS